MTRETVESILRDYKENTSRRLYLEALIEKTEADIEAAKREYIEDTVSTTSHADGLPRGTGISDPTARVGTNAALIDSGDYTPEMARGMIRNVQAYKRELENIRFEINCVLSWLPALNERELFVIELKVIGGCFWSQLEAEFDKRFGQHYSKTGLKGLREQAFDKIVKIAR